MIIEMQLATKDYDFIEAYLNYLIFLNISPVQSAFYSQEGICDIYKKALELQKEKEKRIIWVLSEDATKAFNEFIKIYE